MVSKFGKIVRNMAISYGISAILLLILAFCLFQFHWSELVVDVGIVGIYAISVLVGANLTARVVSSKKVISGALFGLGYCMILVGVSMLMNHGGIADIVSMLRCIVASLLAGGIGAFFSF